MAEELIYTKESGQAQPESEDINWLENWTDPINFPDASAKEAYKGLVRIYLTAWLSMYNSFRPEGEKYEIKEFKELPASTFRLSVKLHPPVKRGPHDPRTHLIPPAPPPPPGENDIH